MKESILARRYAKALFALALERNILDKIRSELHGFAAVLEENEEFAHFFRSPENSRASKREAAERVLQDRYSNLFFNFLLLIIQKGRYGIIDEIVRAFDDLYDRHHRRARALAITAVPMDARVAADLRSRLSKSLNIEIEIENRVDPQILGGLVLNVDGKVMNGSIKQQLERLRAEFLGRRN
jgi:F-type H+-transporting ATPase subunit delta